MTVGRSLALHTVPAKSTSRTATINKKQLCDRSCH